MRYSIACDHTIRISIDAFIILTLVTFKSVIVDDLPAVFTSLDKYTFYSITFVAIQSVYDSLFGLLTSTTCSAGFYDLIAFIISLLIVISVNLALAIWIFFYAYKNRAMLYRASKLANSDNADRLFT